MTNSPNCRKTWPTHSLGAIEWSIRRTHRIGHTATVLPGGWTGLGLSNLRQCSVHLHTWLPVNLLRSVLFIQVRLLVVYCSHLNASSHDPEPREFSRIITQEASNASPGLSGHRQTPRGSDRATVKVFSRPGSE